MLYAPLCFINGPEPRARARTRPKPIRDFLRSEQGPISQLPAFAQGFGENLFHAELKFVKV